MHQSTFFWTPFHLYFFRLFHLPIQFLCRLTCLNLVQSWIFCATLHLVSEFLFFVLFCMLWKLVTVKKLKNTANISNADSRFCLSIHYCIGLLTSGITIFSEAHDMQGSNTKNFSLIGYLSHTFSLVFQRILVTRAYNKNPSIVEKQKLPSIRPKTLARRGKIKKKESQLQSSLR